MTTSTIARVTALRDGYDVTHELNAANFNWFRKSSRDKSGDADWALAHQGMKEITLTGEDIDFHAIITCRLTVNTYHTDFGVKNGDLTQTVNETYIGHTFTLHDGNLYVNVPDTYRIEDNVLIANALQSDYISVSQTVIDRKDDPYVRDLWTSLNITNEAITAKANQSDINNLTGRIAQAEGRLDVAAREIALKVSRSEYINSPVEPLDDVVIGTVWFDSANKMFRECVALTPNLIEGTHYTWITTASARVVTSGINIDAEHILMSSKNIVFELTDPYDPERVLLRIDLDGAGFDKLISSVIESPDVVGMQARNGPMLLTVDPVSYNNVTVFESVRAALQRIKATSFLEQITKRVYLENDVNIRVRDYINMSEPLGIEIEGFIGVGRIELYALNFMVFQNTNITIRNCTVPVSINGLTLSNGSIVAENCNRLTIENCDIAGSSASEGAIHASATRMIVRRCMGGNNSPYFLYAADASQVAFSDCRSIAASKKVICANESLVTVGTNAIDFEKVNCWDQENGGQVFVHGQKMGLGGSFSAQVSLNRVNITLGSGTSFVATATPNGGSPPYSYRYAVFRDGNLISQQPDSHQIPGYEYVPTVAGTYYVTVVVTDGYGSTVTAQSSTVSVSAQATSPLSVYAYAAQTSISYGSPITWYFSASGGTPPYQYRYVLYVNGSQAGSGSWSSSATHYVGAANFTGSVTITVYAQDKNGLTESYTGATVTVSGGPPSGTGSQTLYASAYNTRRGSEWRGSSQIYQGAFITLGEVGIDNVPGNQLNYGCIWFSGLSGLYGKTIQSAKLTVTRGSGAGYSGSITIGAFAVANASASGSVITSGRTVYTLGTIGGYNAMATLDCRNLIQTVVSNGWTAIALCDPMFPLDTTTRSSSSNCRTGASGMYTVNYTIFLASGVRLEITYL